MISQDECVRISQGLRLFVFTSTQVAKKSPARTQSGDHAKRQAGCSGYRQGRSRTVFHNSIRCLRTLRFYPEGVKSGYQVKREDLRSSFQNKCYPSFVPSGTKCW
jgi:hypothetical protein